MAGARAGEPVASPRRRDQVAIVMNLPGAISPATTSFAAARKSARVRVLARERAEDELRHRHVRRRLDAVAGDVAEHDGEPAVGELEEVVDVAADVDARRRTRTPRRSRGLAARRATGAGASAASCPRTPSAAGRAGRCRSPARPAPAIERASASVSRVDRPVGVERDERQRPDHLGRGRDRDHGGGRALREERAPAARTTPPSSGARCRASARGAGGCGGAAGAARSSSGCGRGAPPARRPPAARPRRAALRHELRAARVGQPDHRPRRRRATRDRLARAPRASRRARGSARTTREISYSARRRGAASRSASSACSSSAAERRRLLVQAGVLHRDRELRRRAPRAARLVVGGHAPAGTDTRRAGRSPRRPRRAGARRRSRCRRARARARARRRGAARPQHPGRPDAAAAVGPERELEQPFGHDARAGPASAAGVRVASRRSSRR